MLCGAGSCDEASLATVNAPEVSIIFPTQGERASLPAALRSALAQDFDHDGLDELMLWDHDRIWIYHSDADIGGDRAKLLRRERPPLYNMSNFQSYWSRPIS